MVAPQAPLVKNGWQTGQNAELQVLGCHQFTYEPWEMGTLQRLQWDVMQHQGAEHSCVESSKVSC